MTSAAFDVAAIGNALVDVIADATDDFLKANSIAKGAMTLIDTARAESLYQTLKPEVQMSGGSAANTVAGIASLGGKAAFMGKVNADELGGIYQRDLQAQGVHFATKPSKVNGTPTGRCLIFVTPDAERSMNTYLGAATEFSQTDVDEETLQNAHITYLEGYLFDQPAAKKAFRHAAMVAHASGRQLSLALSDVFCVDRHRNEFLDLVKNNVDILFANQKELMALYQTKDVHEAIAIARQQCKIAVTTRSEKGAIIAAGDETAEIAPVMPKKLVDSTGAGDLFAAGFFYGLTHGKSLAEAGHIGATAAAEVISHYGPRPQRSLKQLIAGTK